MYLGMTRSWWTIVGVLLVSGIGLLAFGEGFVRLLGGLVLVAAIGVFAAAPTGAESRRKEAQRQRQQQALERQSAAPPAATPSAPKPPPAAPYRPARKIEGGDPSEV